MAQPIHDQACRYLAKLNPQGFLAWLLGIAITSFRFRRWLDTCGIPFPGQPDRIRDTVAHVENLAEGGFPWAIIVEFQGIPDTLMPGRVQGYGAEVWVNLKPDLERA